MSYTESGRLAALKETIRVCTVNDAINRVRCSQKDPYGNSTAANYGNSESGRIAALQSNCCNTNTNNGSQEECCPDVPAIPLKTYGAVAKAVPLQGSLIKRLEANAIACGPSVLEQHISAGGIQESLRLQRLRDEVVALDYATNPNARYQRFVPPICPPAANANNLPLTQPKFPCAPNVIGFTLN